MGDSPLFGNRRTVDNPADVVRKLSSALETNDFGLTSLDQLGKQLGLKYTPVPSIVASNLVATYKMEYGPSKILNFADLPGLQFQEEWGRRRSNIISPSSGASNAFSPNEFLLTSKIAGAIKDQPDIVAVYDLLCLLGIRRSEIFAKDTALETISVLLPPGRMVPSQDQTIFVPPEKLGSLLLVPVLEFNRRPASSQLRKVIGLSLFIVSVGDSWEDSRSLSAVELFGLFEERYLLTGPLRDLFISTDVVPKTFSNAVDVNTILRLTMKFVLKQLSLDTESIWQETLTMMEGSTERFALLLCDWLTDEKVIEFAKSNLDDATKARVLELVRPLDFIHRKRSVLLQLFSVKSHIVNREEDPPSDSVTLYEPGRRLSLFLMRRGAERFPGVSLKWAVPWHYFMSNSISSLRALTNSFYREVTTHTNLSLVEIESDLVDDADEFYDLDISGPYKMQYERVKQMSGAEQDYSRLKEKLSVLKTNVTLRDQRLLSIVIFLFGALTVSVTVYTATSNGFLSVLPFGVSIIIIPFIGRLIGRFS